jgi:hypothetical protein
MVIERVAGKVSQKVEQENSGETIIRVIYDDKPTD